MDINKRTILWIVFAVSLVVLWNNWMVSTGQPSMFAPQPPAKTAPVADAKKSESATAAANAAATAGAVPGAAAVDGAAAPFKSELITITTDVVRADIDTQGGVIRRLELLNYKENSHPGWFNGCFGWFKWCQPGDNGKNVVLFDIDSSTNKTYLGQTGLINAPGAPNHTSPFVAKPGARMLNDGNQVQLVLESESGGVKLTKTFTFKRGDYVVDVRHDVTNTGTAAVNPTLYMRLVHDGNKPATDSFFSSSYTGPTMYTAENKYEKLKFDTLEKEAKEAEKTGKPMVQDHVTHADNGWIAISQHFFVSAFIPQDKQMHEIATEKISTNLYGIGVKQPLGTLAPGATISNNARLYSGPQISKLLEPVSPGLELVKDYGWLAIIAKPMFWVMEHIHAVLGNWGWTIIAFTILIKLLFFPLSAAGYKSMAKIKLVTPKIQAIRERYKGDPAKMNQATMELYKTEKINPLGGCLPILIQMPVFISLYYVLQAAVEVRGAPWIGWITDLSQHDPFGILPVLYAISMFITTKLNPAPADPMQAKIMLFMPLVFSVMFFVFPSGLVLYWVVNNVLSIAQQWVITKKYSVPEPAKA